MKVSRRLAYPLALAFLCVLAVPAARADKAWRTPLRLSEPTEIPGKVLQPGEYVIKVVDTQRIRSIVQFLNPAETEVIATVLAVPTRQVPSAPGTEFTYFQRYEGAPQAMKTWIYPGENFGVEFVYPKAEAMTIAEKTHETVYATPAPEPTLESEVVQVTPERKEIPYHAEPLPALPKTGSDLPLVGLLAAASLAGAAGLRLLGNRIG